MTDTDQLPCEREAFEAFAQNCPMGKYSIARRGDGYDSSHTQLMWDAWQARAIIALRPSAVPMTGEEIREAEKRSYIDTRRPVFTDDCWGEEKVEYEPTKVFNFFMFARAIEAHHGITAQAKKETP